MNPEVLNIWINVKEIIKNVAIYIMPIAAFIVSVIALIKSNESLDVKIKLSEVEEKLIEYELALKQNEYEKIQANEVKKACIEVRIINLAKNKYKLKVWNSGNARAYNVEVSIPSEYNITIMKTKMPFEYLGYCQVIVGNFFIQIFFYRNISIIVSPMFLKIQPLQAVSSWILVSFLPILPYVQPQDIHIPFRLSSAFSLTAVSPRTILPLFLLYTLSPQAPG